MTMKAFTYESRPGRVVFGEGSMASVAAEVERLGLTRVVVLSGAELKPLADQVAGLIGSACAGVIAEAVMHTPVDVSEAVLTKVEAIKADGLVAILSVWPRPSRFVLTCLRSPYRPPMPDLK
jgi:maleylacetate reductase